ncbi:hypothetical protein AAF712_013030 [Marasmius tenuissimus]|uniref:Uncharacterized protein n=1 Tax=Marasmius tenuissimus TaxID=585030 RepID=A0ABR2ZHI2_9AGAR
MPGVRCKTSRLAEGTSSPPSLCLIVFVWLTCIANVQESQNVTDLRDKIKSFLASQGMIKGHSGPSQRTQTHPEESQEERATLKLASEGYPSSASESPPANNHLVLSSSAEGNIRHAQVSVSNVREDGHWAGSPFPTGSIHETHPVLHHSPQATRPESPVFDGNNTGFQEPQYDPSLMAPTHNSTTIAPPPYLVPIHASSYGSSYSWAPRPGDEDMVYNVASTFGAPEGALSLTIPAALRTHGLNDEWVQRYIEYRVLNKQYQLADDRISEIIIDSIQSDGTARASASFLATVYFQRKTNHGRVHALGDSSIQEKYAQLEGVLKKEHHDNNDAIGALNVISAFLFDGGYGNWEEWLGLAVKQSHRILTGGRFIGGLKDALVNSSGSEQFIVKTTIWFDVLASVTRMRRPSLYEVIQELFDPNQATVYEEGSTQALSMMAIMGCEGRIIWALAQISALARMKEAYAERGALDTMFLVRRCTEIETLLHPPVANSLENEEVHRKLTSEVFRNAARLYLYTIVHGDFPNVQPIRQAVEDTFAALQAARQYSEVGQIVIRSTVFAVLMIGCLCKDRETQRKIVSQLRDDEGIVYGNFKGVVEVMEQVWKERENSAPKDPVPWRRALYKTRLLLV